MKKARSTILSQNLNFENIWNILCSVLLLSFLVFFKPYYSETCLKRGHPLCQKLWLLIKDLFNINNKEFWHCKVVSQCIKICLIIEVYEDWFHYTFLLSNYILLKSKFYLIEMYIYRYFWSITIWNNWFGFLKNATRK